MGFDADIAPPELAGRRVRLVPMELQHVDPLCKAGGDPRIWPYMPVKAESAADLSEYFRRAVQTRASGQELHFAIFDKEQGKFVGSTAFLDITPAHKALEIGWTWLNPSVWRTSVNTECKYLLLTYAFETLGAIRVFFKTDARNERSQKALERIGAVREGVLRHHRIMPDGYLRDSVYFSILAGEWPAVKMRLEGYLGCVGNEA